MKGAAARSAVAAAVSLASALGVDADALASSITNRDDTAYRISIVEENAVTEHNLAPAATVSGICAGGCVLHLNRDPHHEGYTLQGTDVVSIENGYLYYDAPPASAAPADGDDVERPEVPRNE